MNTIRVAIFYFCIGLSSISFAGNKQSDSNEDGLVKKILDENSFAGLNKEEFNLSIDYNNNGIKFMENGNLEEAIKAFDNAIDINPRFVWAYDNKGIVLGRMSQFEEAVQAFDSAIKYNPNFIKAYSAKALALSKLGLYREALDSINIVINKKHGSAYDYSIRATSLFGLKKLEEANKAIDQAILLESDSAKVSNYFYNKALILKDLGRIQEAIEACNKSLKYNQSNHNTTNLKKDLEKK